MPSAKTVWGIDVGQCALKALKLRYRDNHVQAVSFDVIEHAKILSQPDADEQQLIRSALSKFLSRNNIRGSTLVVSVPGQASFTRFIKLPPVEQKKIPEIVRYEARQQIPFNLEDVIWDYQQISPPSAGPREVEVGIFAMKRDIVADYVSDFLAMKLEPDIVQMAPVALYNFLRFDKRDGGGASILIDVGAENTNLVIADGERVWIRPVPIGGNNFTQALCKAFKLPFSKAENLKRHAAESKHARKVFQAMRPVYGELLTEVQRSIGYYTSLHRDSRIERVVALGNAFRLANLRKFLSQNLGVEVEKVEKLAGIDDDEALKAPLFRENVLSFGVAYGLAIQGLGLASIGTSLLPPQILNQKVLRRKRPFFVAAAACLLGGVFAFGYDAIKRSGEIEARAGAVDRAAEAVSTRAQTNARKQEAFEEKREALLKENNKLAGLRELVASDSYAYELLRHIWTTAPYDPRFTADRGPDAPSVARSSFEQLELLNVSAHYVEDVRDFSIQVGRVGGAGAAMNIRVLEPGAEPPVGPGSGPAMLGGPREAEPEEEVPELAGPVPGVRIQIVGITPQPWATAGSFVNHRFLEPLRNDDRTVTLMTPNGPEVLAGVLLTDRYRNSPQYDVLEGREAKTAAAAAMPGMPGATPETEPRFEKGDDYWFTAQWVVHLPETIGEAEANRAAEGDVAEGEDEGGPEAQTDQP